MAQVQKFVIANKWRIIILFNCPCSYKHFKEELTKYWVKIVLDNFSEEKIMQEDKYMTLTIIIQGYLQLYINVLSMEWDEGRMLKELKAINRYHIFGLASILEGFT